MSRVTNIESRNRPLDRGAESRPPRSRVENIRPFRRDYDALGLGQRNGPDNVVVLD